MMSNVIAFQKAQPDTSRTSRVAAGPVTLFVHVKRTTLIAHLTGRFPADAAQNGRLGKR